MPTKSSSQSESLSLYKANFNDIKECASIALLGKRRTGKTTWAKCVMQFLKGRADRFMAICGNKDCEGEWQKVIPDCFVVNKDIDFLSQIVAYQNARADEHKHDPNGIPTDQRLVLIIDDCGSDNKFMYSPVIKDILSNGRHYGIYCVFLLQYLTQLHPQNRCQMDYVGVLATNNHNNIKKVHSEYGGNCSFQVFQRILAAATAAYGMCWIDNTLHVNYVPNSLNVSNMFYMKLELTGVDIDEKLCPSYIYEYCESISSTSANDTDFPRAIQAYNKESVTLV